jgi:transposase
VFNTQNHALQAVNEALSQAPVTQPDGTVAVLVPPPSPPRLAEELAHQRRAQRLALYQQIGALHRQGWPGHALATQLGIGNNTVFRSLRTPTFPERTPGSDRGRRLLTPYTPYLLERWNAGCRDALRLFRELQQRGDAGSDVTVARDAPRRRQAPGQPPRQRRPRHPLPLVTAPPHRSLTPRRAPWLVLPRPEQRTSEEEHLLAQLTARDATLAHAIALAQDRARLVRQRQPAPLAPWLARAAESPLLPLPRLATGLRDDYAAVKAGVTLPWSNGPVDGHSNRLKMLKRQMCGRARLDLLQRRFLLAA